MFQLKLQEFEFIRKNGKYIFFVAPAKKRQVLLVVFLFAFK